MLVSRTKRNTMSLEEFRSHPTVFHPVSTSPEGCQMFSVVWSGRKKTSACLPLMNRMLDVVEQRAFVENAPL